MNPKVQFFPDFFLWKWRFNFFFPDHVISFMLPYFGAALSSFNALPSFFPRRYSTDPLGPLKHHVCCEIVILLPPSLFLFLFFSFNRSSKFFFFSFFFSPLPPPTLFYNSFLPVCLPTIWKDMKNIIKFMGKLV